MSWRDLLQEEDEVLILPWVGGGSLPWQIDGKGPKKPGWYKFKRKGRKIQLISPVEESNTICLKNKKFGYLIGDRFIPDDIKGLIQVRQLAESLQPVHLIDPGLDRFVRVSVGSLLHDSPLIFNSQEFPIGPEDSVLQAFFDGKKDLSDIPGVSPALNSAFNVEVWRRDEEEKIRKEEERIREETRKRKEAEEKVGTAEGRRDLAKFNFKTAAIAALQVGNAKYVDHRNSVNKNEMVVRYSVDNRQLECVCDKDSLRIIDAGVCLVNHTTGEKGDARFTLESLPAVIRQAIKERKLVVWRHVGGVNYDEDEDEDW